MAEKKHGKKYIEAAKLVEADKAYEPREAVELSFSDVSKI